MTQYFQAALEQYSIYEYLWFFLIYSVLGWCLEVAYHVVTLGHFVNRGFLNGPVCPIYGAGMVVIIFFLLPLSENSLALYFGAVLLATVLEFITGMVLEKLFHQRWWDYSNEPFNLKGHICIKFSLLWGLACLLVVNLIHPVVDTVIWVIPKFIGVILLIVLYVFLLADVVNTVFAVNRLNGHLQAMQELAEDCRSISEAMGMKITDATLLGMEASSTAVQMLKGEIVEQEDITESVVKERYQRMVEEFERKNKKLQQLQQPQTIWQRRLIKAFPSMRSLMYEAELQEMQNAVSRKRA